MRSHAKAVFVVAALCSFFTFAGQVSAAPYFEVGTFAGGGFGPGGEGSEDGQLFYPGQLDVNDSTGDVYVADTNNNRVEVFKPTASGGEYDSQAAVAGGPTGLAIDQSNGDVYVATSTGVSKLDADLNPIGSGWTDPGLTGALAVDPSSGDLLLADLGANLIRRFHPDGTPGATFPAERPVDLAANSTGEIFVVTSTGNITGLTPVDCGPTSAVERFDAAGVSQGTVGSLTTPGAVAVDPDDDSIAVAAHVGEYACEKGFLPEVAFFDPSGTARGAIKLSADTVYAMVPGLASAAGGSPRTYAVTKSPNGDQYGRTKITAIESIPPAPPTATTLPADQVQPTLAKLQGEVNPENAPTTYWFEYGTTTAYGSSVPLDHDASAGEDNQPVAVSRFVNGLQPGTTYHYRLVAKNDLGEAPGADRTFTTTVEAAPGGGGERHFELVSPADKEGYDVKDSQWATGVSQDGSRVAYASVGSFAGAHSSPVENMYVAERTADGWSNRAITPAWFPTQDRSIEPWYQLFSEDLTHAALFTSDPALAPGAQADTGNVYIRDTTTDDNPFRLATPSGPPHTRIDDYKVVIAAASRDFKHVVFESPWALTPDAPVGAVSNVYEWDEGETRLASVLPDGTAAPGGYVGADFSGTNVFPGARGFSYAFGAVSADGSRVFFTNEADGQIYVRENGNETRRISPGTQPASYFAASTDGNRVFFSSQEALTDDALTDGTEQLYMYDVDSETLTDLSTSGQPSGTGIGIGGLVGLSEDGTSVYFVSNGDVYFWRGGSSRYVATLRGGLPTETCNYTESLAFCGAARLSRVTPDGRYMLLSSVEPLDGYDTDGLRQLFLYDSQSEELRCVSCSSRLTKSTGPSYPFSSGVVGRYHGYEARALLPDGRVIFETDQALVPADTNGKIDVYLWNQGKLQLISTGQGEYDAHFGGASASGDDVFVLTRQPLSPADHDNNVDVYDARLSASASGSSTQQAVPCSGDSCQGQSAAPTPLGAPATANYQGEGNRKPHRAKKAKARKHTAKKHRSKHHRKKKASAKSRANHNRGGAK